MKTKNPIFTFSIIILMTLGFTSCGGDNTEYNEKMPSDTAKNTVDYATFSKELEDLETKILAQSPPDENLMREATTKFQDFAGYFPEDPKAPEYLLKASDYAFALGQFSKSVKILDRIVQEYPNYERMEDVMFNKASHLDFELRDTTNAKIAYQEFITKFPNSDLVDDAQSRIDNIAYSLDELAEKFINEMEKKPQ